MALNRIVPGVPVPGALRLENRQTGDFKSRQPLAPGPVEAGLRGGAPASPMQAGQRARWTLGAMVGRSSEMERLFLQMRYVASHLRIALIEGERGTGKELTARTLHDLSNARGRNFVACRAADFFVARDLGQQLSAARGGTLYLSGIDSLNAEGQGRLLHLLGWLGGQGKPGSRAVPIGMAAGDEGDAGPGVPRALIVSSERSLRSLVLYGSFRGELHAQVSAVQLAVPALRDRRGDIPMLVEAILAHAANAHGRPLCGMLQEALTALAAQPWPGNVEQLREAILQAAARSEGEWLRRADLLLPGEGPGRAGMPGAGAPSLCQGISSPGATRTMSGATWVAPSGAGPRLAALHPEPATRLGAEAFGRQQAQGSGYGFAPRPVRSEEPEPELDPNLDRAILRHIRRVLESVGGNKLRAARLLGISRSTLYRLLDSETPERGSRSTESRFSAEMRERPAISALRR